MYYRVDDAPKVDPGRRARIEALVGPFPDISELGHVDAARGLKQLLDVAQGHLCGICGQPLHIPVANRSVMWRSPNIHHVVPKARGGKDSGNRVRAHLGCNAEWGDDWPTGCQIVFLAATNARAHAFVAEWTADPDTQAQRRRDKARRKRQRRAARKAEIRRMLYGPPE